VSYANLTAVKQDDDALVVGIRGVYYTCKSPSNQVFVATTKLVEPLRIGDIVSYEYVNKTSSGLPVRAVIFKKRVDLLWENGSS